MMKKDNKTEGNAAVSISKVVTKKDAAGKPVSVELGTVVKCMSSEKARQGVELLLEGDRDAAFNRLPRLLFSGTFGRGGVDDLRDMTGLLLMDVACPQGVVQAAELRQRVSRVPYTILAFVGSSHLTLKVVVRVAYSDGRQPKDRGDYERLLVEGQQVAQAVYRSLAGVELRLSEQPLLASCRMSYDTALCYQPEAQALPVVADTLAVLAPYSAAVAEDDGSVRWYPEHAERDRIQREFYACLARAISDSAQCDVDNSSVGDSACSPSDSGGVKSNDGEALVARLAGYCHKARLEEESCVRRTLWQSRVELSETVVRRIFRAAYAKPYRGRTLSQMNQKERIATYIREFMERRYEVRYNVVKQVVEFRPHDQLFKPWQPLTERDLNRMAFEEMQEGGEGWPIDIELYLKSSLVETYNPILEFLSGVGQWDGRRDYIEEYARRLKTDYAEWPRLFHRWFLAMVAQALNLNRDYGNSVVPLLIGTQAMKKSTFCKNILPPSMREYYMDDIKMDNAEQVERVLGRMWLVNIDEYNAKTDREQAKIKRLLTEKDVQVRKMRSDQYTMTPRLCSFIATTNETRPLTDPSGSRRYLCVEMTGQADMSGRVPYRQMYAQAVAELRHGEQYWFDNDDERLIQEHNSQYQQLSTTDEVLTSFFEPAGRSKEFFMTSTAIQNYLDQHLKGDDVPSLGKLGRALRRHRFLDGAQNGVHGYYLRRREQ